MRLLLKITCVFLFSLYTTSSWSYIYIESAECKNALASALENPLWNLGFTKKAAKQERKLLPKVKKKLEVILDNLEKSGPVVNCMNFSKIENSRYGEHLFHCHINYRNSVIWRVHKEEKFIQIIYVGSREKAPYR